MVIVLPEVSFVKLQLSLKLLHSGIAAQLSSGQFLTHCFGFYNEVIQLRHTGYIGSLSSTAGKVDAGKRTRSG